MHVSTLYNPGKIRDKLPQLTAKARVIKIKSSSPPPPTYMNYIFRIKGNVTQETLVKPNGACQTTCVYSCNARVEI